MSQDVAYAVFLGRIIDDGVAAAERDYAGEDRSIFLAGAREGFEACRKKTPVALRELLSTANTAATTAALQHDVENYWRLRVRAVEIEWVCQCVSVILSAFGFEPIEYGMPTIRATLKAWTVTHPGGTPSLPLDRDLKHAHGVLDLPIRSSHPPDP